ncbi:MAG: sterol desaturase family protein [Bacteroidetes bacterium]|nr:sterol desaturase family protein [Bacteroidota bacterium]
MNFWMDYSLMDWSKFIPFMVLILVGIIESIGGLYFEDRRSRNDWTMELVSLTMLPTLIKPGIFALVLFTLNQLSPNSENVCSHWHWIWQTIAFLIVDDLTQYWWHRASHRFKWLWKLHRPHHVIEEMGVLVTYRNAVLYYAMMPGLWLSAALVYFGMGKVYAVYLVVKLVVILLAHSETKWDRILYSQRWLQPIAWIIERLISTPATHYAHHGLTVEDGISNPNGNFGNLLFLWDVLFGTAKITRRYPTKFGAWNTMKEPWYVQLFFPFIRSKDPKSELHSLRTSNDYDPKIDPKQL